MPGRLADAIDELAQPSRPQRKEEPQIQADPALRRPRLLRNAPAAVVAVIVVGAAAAAGWATFWVLGVPAVSDRLGLLSERPAIRIAAPVLVGVVLCGYLRLPYDADSGDNHLTEFVSTTTWSATPPATHIEEQRRQAIRQNDREVRNTIIRVVARRLQSNADTSWSGNDFDFTGVLFEEASLGGATFSGRNISFQRATFRDENTDFGGAGFNAENVWFDDAKFESDAVFTGAMFRARRISFDGATFGGKNNSFDEAKFTGEYVSFRGASFAGEKTTFLSTKFKCLRASFDSPAEWKNVEFDWDTGEKACRRFLVASRRDHGRPTWLARSRSPVRAPWQH